MTWLGFGLRSLRSRLGRGANLHETILNVSAVNVHQFGKIFEREVDGDTYAQPLIKTGVTIPGVGLRDVVYVATANNSLYAGCRREWPPHKTLDRLK